MKLNDFSSAGSWTILSRKMVVQIALGQIPRDNMLGTIWRIV